MEGGEDEKTATATETETAPSSYRYWVRSATDEAAPPPVPRKLSPQDLQNQNLSDSKSLGSVWNKAGTWEERNLSSWATARIQELLGELGCMEFGCNKVRGMEVSKCTGEATVVTVRNKKRIGYSFEISLKFQGEWLFNDETKEIEGVLNIPEASFGDLDDMQLDVEINKAENILESERSTIIKDLQYFLTPIKNKLVEFEAELKDK